MVALRRGALDLRCVGWCRRLVRACVLTTVDAFHPILHCRPGSELRGLSALGLVVFSFFSLAAVLGLLMPLLSYSVSLFAAAASICTVPCPVFLPSAWIVLGIFGFFVGHVPRRGCSIVRFLLPTCVGRRVVLVHLFSFFFVVFFFHHLFGVREAAPHGGGTCTPSTFVCTGLVIPPLRG